MSTPFPSQSTFISSPGVRTLSIVAVSIVATPLVTLAILVFIYRFKRSRLESNCQSALSLSDNILPMEKQRVAAEDPQSHLVSEVTEFSLLINWY